MFHSRHRIAASIVAAALAALSLTACGSKDNAVKPAAAVAGVQASGGTKPASASDNSKPSGMTSGMTSASSPASVDARPDRSTSATGPTPSASCRSTASGSPAARRT